MRIYEVRISHGALVDMAELRKFLKSMMTVEGAIRYANNMREEIKMLALYANLYGKSTSISLRQIHPEARRMMSHNRRWIYVYHIEENFVVVDRILPAKMNKG
jgi:plasmid stabilization system protein ParE